MSPVQIELPKNKHILFKLSESPNKNPDSTPQKKIGIERKKILMSIVKPPDALETRHGGPDNSPLRLQTNSALVT